MSKRFLLAITSGLVVFTSAFAFAASLGTITTDTVGASNAAVGSCDTDGVSTSYASSWSATNKRYDVTQVTVRGVADTCDGLTMKVSATGASDAHLGEGTLVIPTSNAVDHTVTLATPVSAAALTGVHVIIGG